MGHIKEPKGVDFIIQSKPLADKERAAISEYIRCYKARQKARGSRKATIERKSKNVSS